MKRDLYLIQEDKIKKALDMAEMKQADLIRRLSRKGIMKRSTFYKKMSDGFTLAEVNAISEILKVSPLFLAGRRNLSDLQVFDEKIRNRLPNVNIYSSVFADYPIKTDGLKELKADMINLQHFSDWLFTSDLCAFDESFDESEKDLFLDYPEYKKLLRVLAVKDLTQEEIENTPLAGALSIGQLNHSLLHDLRTACLRAVLDTLSERGLYVPKVWYNEKRKQAAIQDKKRERFDFLKD